MAVVDEQRGSVVQLPQHSTMNLRSAKEEVRLHQKNVMHQCQFAQALPQ
jgi:hypothetical protein